MKEASLFILLPNGNEVYDMSLDKETLRDMMTPLMQIKTFASAHDIRLRIYYDIDNITTFMRDAEDIVDDGTYLNRPSSVLRNFISSQSTDVQKKKLLEAECCYIRWDSLTDTSTPDVPLIIKSAYESPEAPCVFSLSSNVPTDYHIVSIIKDRQYREGLPELRNIPLFYSEIACIEWMSSWLDGHFSLIGNESFEPTHYRWIKQRIYRKHSDGNYWYFDFFHRENRIHYEVFDEAGKHIGEAAENGEMIPDTRDENKSISQILHGN